MENKIYSINGPVVTVLKTRDFSMQEMVLVGEKKIIGEVIGVETEKTTIQLYEDTTGLKPGEKVVGSGHPMSVTLGPGILSNIFDGIERPLQALAQESGAFLQAGSTTNKLDLTRRFDVTLCVQIGDRLCAGDIFATCPETSLIEHRAMVPPSVGGEVTFVAPNGSYTLEEPLVRLTDDMGREHTLTLCQHWPIRMPRPCKKRLPINRPLITGQRVIDTLFPIAKGGTAAIPGGFGTGKTMTQHQLAKWSDADIIVYIGCGERGNEMTQVLNEFSELIDPRSGKALTDRTVLIANTSNMPVAAREASIYTGITLAEYYRDMGYDVAIMADSTSRWAEALREISGRLEEMPAEEGFPAYLPSRLSEFYERAGSVETLGGKTGSVTIIGAVSPQGSDFSEPVTQNTKRFTRCFLALDKALAYERHYPAINWNNSYSEYSADLAPFYREEVCDDFMQLRERLMVLLIEENKLLEIVKLVGTDVLPDNQRLVIEVARVIRSGFLQQNAYHKEDTYVPLSKQYQMMRVILRLYDAAQELLKQNIPIEKLRKSGIFEELIRMKYETSNDDPKAFERYDKKIDACVTAILEENRSVNADEH